MPWMILPLLRRLKCFFGFHDWDCYGGNVQSDQTLITLIWWECPHCAETKVRCIFHNN